MKNIYLNESKNPLKNMKSGKTRALVVSKPEWQKISDNVNKEKNLMEIIEQKRIEDERRKELSKEMAKTWDNTVLNLRRRRLELRRERAENLENDRRKRFLQMRQEEADLKKKVTVAAKEVLQREKDSAKKLISQFRFSEVLRERAEQLKFQSKLKSIEAEREHNYIKSIIEDVKRFEAEEKEKEVRNIEKKKKLTAEAQEEFRQFFEKKKKEEEERLRLEREDIINITKEINMEKENSLKEHERKKNLILEDVVQNRKMIHDFMIQKQFEEDEEENAVRIHAAAKKKIAFIRKMKESEMREKAQEKRNKISLQLSNEEAERAALEEAILKKAIADKEAVEEEDRKHRQVHQEMLVTELKNERKRFLESEEQRRIKENEKAKWQLMQRFKQTEENEKFYEQMRKEKIKKIQDNRAMWDKQCEEKAAVAAEERQQDYDAVRRAGQWWEDEDKEFLSYAENLLEESKKKGRPLFPMLQYIEQYKKENNLVKPPPLHKTWKSNVPINSSSKETQTPVENEKIKCNTQCHTASTYDKIKNKLNKKHSLDEQHKKKIEPWPKCGEVCTRQPQNSNGLQNV